jgi:Ca2+-transporting ATPase
LFGPRHIGFATLQGLIVFLGLLAFFGWALGQAPEAEARGATFCALVFANLVLALSDASGGRADLFDRRRLAFWTIAALAFAGLIAIFVVPVLGDILKVSPPPPGILVVGLGVALVTSGWFGFLKLANRLRLSQRAV